MSESTRLRLVEAMAAVVVDKGYPATTIADIVAQAHVSRRTFYEHFSDKDACLLACHEIVGNGMQMAIETAQTETSSTENLIERTVVALMESLAAQRDLTYTHFAALRASGATTSDARRRVQEMIAKQLQGIAARVQQQDRQVKIPSDPMATAVIGGIGELIVRTVESGSVDDLDQISPTVTELITSVLMSSRR